MNHSLAEEEMVEQAALYALGALSQHEARAFEQHVAEGCEECEAELRKFEQTVTHLAFDAPEALPSGAAREELLSRLSSEAKPAGMPASMESFQPFVVRATEGDWYPMCEGVSFKRLFADPAKGTVTTIIKMSPGSQIPMHRHHGIEECYVVEGDVSSSGDTLYGGDYTCVMKDSIHSPITTVNGALLLIVAPDGFDVVEA